ncbi:hypothetical protein FQZ97_1177160 [compost metagenome]
MVARTTGTTLVGFSGSVGFSPGTATSGRSGRPLPARVEPGPEARGFVSVVTSLAPSAPLAIVNASTIWPETFQLSTCISPSVTSTSW